MIAMMSSASISLDAEQDIERWRVAVDEVVTEVRTGAPTARHLRALESARRELAFAYLHAAEGATAPWLATLLRDAARHIGSLARENGDRAYELEREASS